MPYTGDGTCGLRGWTSAPNLGADSQEECCWGPQTSAEVQAQTPLGCRSPRPRAERCLGRSRNGVWGVGPAAVCGRILQKHSFGEAAPGFGAEPQMIQSSQPVWSRREQPYLSECSLAGGLWGRLSSRTDAPSQTWFRQIWRRSSETKPVVWLNND